MKSIIEHIPNSDKAQAVKAKGIRVDVTKAFLPPIEEYNAYLQRIWVSGLLTNQGPLLNELESKLKAYLKVKNLHFVSNGTIALQLAINSLGINSGEIITTPFSYVATTSAILWERCTPVYVDINYDNFCIDVNKIEQAITPKTKAILAVHVFGNPCNVEKIDAIAKKYNLKVIYDGAHAFGVKYNNKSILSYGDVSTCSFHATKLFHTVEGGICIAKREDVNKRLELAKRFGHNNDNHLQLGINGKNSEVHAAMGLANFPYINKIIEERKSISMLYDNLLPNLQRPKKQKEQNYNYAYYPVVFKNEKILLKAFEALNKENIFPRKYFFPSLNKLPYTGGQTCQVSEDISSRIACLPLYAGLEAKVVEKIARIINGI